MEGRRRIYAQNVLNFQKSVFVEKVLKGSQEGSSPWGCRWGRWVSTTGALLRDLVQGESVTSSRGCKSGTPPLKAGMLQTEQTKDPGAFVQPRVVTTKPGCASAGALGGVSVLLRRMILEEDDP